MNFNIWNTDILNSVDMSKWFISPEHLFFLTILALISWILWYLEVLNSTIYFKIMKFDCSWSLTTFLFLALNGPLLGNKVICFTIPLNISHSIAQHKILIINENSQPWPLVDLCIFKALRSESATYLYPSVPIIIFKLPHKILTLSKVYRPFWNMNSCNEIHTKTQL